MKPATNRVRLVATVVAVVMVCTIVGLFVSAYRQAMAVREIERLGGSIHSVNGYVSDDGGGRAWRASLDVPLRA